MATLQISETQIACRQHDPKDAVKGMGLSISPTVDETSNIQRTKMRAGCNGAVLFAVQASAGTVTLNLKAGSTNVIDFTSGTIDIVVNDTEPIWGTLPVNGDTLSYWGVRVHNPAGGLTWSKYLILEMSTIRLDLGENYDVASAAFNAKQFLGTGDVQIAFPT